ncbi:MAG: FkbM family methyltransferase [Rhodospirillales bacterium]|nr:FkbM family methyltransferase [Rhodospirillales bacterium]
MTKFLSNLFSFLFNITIFFLPKWKKITCKARLHHLLEPIYETKINNKNIKLFSPNRKCIYWLRTGPHSEPSTNEWISSFSKDDVLVDVGANIGLYSLFAGISGIRKVYAIEANPFSFSVLSRNIIENGLSDKIIALCLPIGGSSSIIKFNLSSNEAGTIGNEIASKNAQEKKLSFISASFSLDELFKIQNITNVNHLKIDVDGIEKDILMGARNLLSNSDLKSVLVEDIEGYKKGRNELDKLMANYGFSNSIAWGQDGSANKIYKKQSA